MIQKKTALLFILAAVAVLIFSVVAYAQPVSPNSITSSTPDRKPYNSSGTAVQSYAGNTTQLLISGDSITSHWQGYYGNVSGEVTLDDADSNTLYSWALANTAGEVYATNTSGTVQWGNITCVNISNATGNGEGATKINGSTLDQQYFISNNDKDNFTKTFSNKFAGSVTIGTRTITAAVQCPSTFLYVDNITQSTDFIELLLFDNLSAVVFTSILEPQGTTGFDNNQWNFEMLVAQRNSSVGTYYFYVELS